MSPYMLLRWQYTSQQRKLFVDIWSRAYYTCSEVTPPSYLCNHDISSSRWEATLEVQKKIVFVKVSQLEKNKSRPGLEAKNEVRAHLKSSMYQTQTGIPDEDCVAQQRNSWSVIGQDFGFIVKQLLNCKFICFALQWCLCPHLSASQLRTALGWFGTMYSALALWALEIPGPAHCSTLCTRDALFIVPRQKI